MLSVWAQEEMATANLEDERLNDRLTQVMSDLGDRSTASIPAACGGYAETRAAYRFFDNDKVTWEKILEPHYEQTRQRISGQEVVLLVQDTSEIDVTRPEKQMVGAGWMDGSARVGAFLHLLEAFTPDGTPLGASWCDIWARNKPSTSTSKEDKRRQRKAAPIEEKESFRWLEGLRQARNVAENSPDVACVCVCDSEADIYELFDEPRGNENAVHLLVRAGSDRALLQEPGMGDMRMRDAVLEAPVLFTNSISVRGRKAKVTCETRGRRQTRESRTTEVEVRAATVTLRPPHRPDRKLSPATVHVVLVSEIDPPKNDTPIEWILVTTLPIGDVEQVRRVVQYYTVRWMIEVLFRTLKSGCRIEHRRFEHIDRFLPCLAVFLIISWRILFACRLARSCPEVDCDAVFEPSEWKSVWMAVHRKSPPNTPPQLAVMVGLIAQLGGYVNRPNRPDPPGPQTLWLGLQRMRDLAWAWDIFGPGANQ
jgi:hypothetical protein